MTSNPYATGTNVYNGGSSAATSGPVDPTGYIDRSLNQQPAIRQSEYTPGVAAGAVATLNANAAGTSTSGTTQAPAATTPIAPATPTQSSTTGAIGYNIPVPYDLVIKGINANSDYQNTILQTTAQRNAAAQEETIGSRNLGIQRTDTQRGDLNRAAYRGMARSSGYADQVDRTAQNYNNMYTDLEAKFYSALNNATATEVGAKSQYDATMEAIQREAAARLADKQASDPNSGAIDPITQGTQDPAPVGTPTTSGPTGSVGHTDSSVGNGANARPTPRPTAPTTPKPAATHVSVIKASKGETLQSLAKKYNMPLATLMKLNPGLKRPNGQWIVYAGSTIHLGGGR